MEENNSGLSTTTLGLLGLGGLGVMYVLARGGWGNNCNNSSFVCGCAPDPYTVGLQQGQTNGSLNCLLAGQNRLESEINSIKNQQYNTVVANNIATQINGAVNQASAELGAAVSLLGTRETAIQNSLDKITGPCAVYSVPLCNSCRTCTCSAIA